MKRAELFALYPFIRPHLPALTATALSRVQEHRDRMVQGGVARLQVIECMPGVPECDRALLTLLRLVDLKAGTAYKRFGLHEVSNLLLGKDERYKGTGGVHTSNLVVDMSGYETTNRKSEEFAITLMEAVMASNATCTFATAAHEDRWSRIRNFAADRGFRTYRVEMPTCVTLPETVAPAETPKAAPPRRILYRDNIST